MEATVMVEIDVGNLFADESVDWRYCMEHATFRHKDACEFILHIGDDD